MLKGYNSDLHINGIHYHIQTEDWGQKNPFLVSHVFKNGAVVKKIKTAYKEVIPEKDITNNKFIYLAMKWQHEAIVGLISKPHRPLSLSPEISK